MEIQLIFFDETPFLIFSQFSSSINIRCTLGTHIKKGTNNPPGLQSSSRTFDGKKPNSEKFNNKLI